MIRDNNYNGTPMVLVNARREPLHIGDVITKDGESFKVSGGRAPHHSGSTGRIYFTRVERPGTGEDSFFPGVLGCQWIPATQPQPVTAPKPTPTAQHYAMTKLEQTVWKQPHVDFQVLASQLNRPLVEIEKAYARAKRKAAAQRI